MQDHKDTKVDRSRLTLLLNLSSTAAAAVCFGPPRGDDRPRGWRAPAAPAQNPSTTFDRRNADSFDDERAGGEGEGEGGGGSH